MVIKSEVPVKQLMGKHREYISYSENLSNNSDAHHGYEPVTPSMMNTGNIAHRMSIFRL
jgi:hypothetical protein